eukprot:4466597-Pleurochrysis_carterae.AAC.2
MRVGQSHRRVAPTVFICSKGECDKHGALREGENATRPTSPFVLVTSVRKPEAPGHKDEFARGAPRRRRKAKMRGLGALCREGSGTYWRPQRVVETMRRRQAPTASEQVGGSAHQTPRQH